jgi:uncharacterized hydrophobic protein (TIGR00341 family)
METRIIQIVAPIEHREKISEAIKAFETIDSWHVNDSSRHNIIYSVLLTLDNCQPFLDKLQSKINSDSIRKVVVSSVEAVLPKEENNSDKDAKKAHISGEGNLVPREELFNQLSNDIKLNLDNFLLIVLSTIVAAMGLVNNQVIAVIAAMVIAPLLSPNLALAFSVVMGDSELLKKSLITSVVGIFLCLLLSFIIGFFWPYTIDSSALMTKQTNVGYLSIVLALASGAAGAISITSSISSALVGVMVAVALLPPLVSAGMLLGSGLFYQSVGAGLLFFVNVVCVNLSANLVFLLKGIRPRTWYEKKKAKTAIFWYLLFWILSLTALCVAIYFHHSEIKIHVN